MKQWRITYFSADGCPGLVIECHRVRKPSRLARARMWMDIHPVRYGNWIGLVQRFLENQKGKGVMLTYQAVVSSLPVITVVVGVVLFLLMSPFSRRGRR